MSEVRFEDLVGQVVRNQHGRRIARIEDVRVGPDGEEYLVTHYLLGPIERLPRIMAFAGELPTLRSLGIGRTHQLRAIPWQWLDLSDPEKPVLREGGRGGKGGRGDEDV
jgi:sporulation protein YlmC with PRC-barrel domain